MRKIVLVIVALVAPLSVRADPITISDSGRGAYEASLAAAADGRAVAVWHDTRGRYSQIYARWLDSDLRPNSPELVLTHDRRHAYEPDAQLMGEDLIVAWYDKDPLTRRLDAKVGAWSAHGERRWVLQLAADTHFSRNPVVRAVGDRLFCAWLEYRRDETPAVWGAWVDRDGRFLERPRRLAAASRTTWNLNAAIDEQGRAWVVFDARAHTRRSELFLIVADPAGQRVARLSKDDRHDSVYPDIAIAGPTVALTWFDAREGNEEVYLFVESADRLLESSGAGVVDSRARRVTRTKGHSRGAYVAWNGEQGGVAWSDSTDGQYDVFFEPFDSDGAATAPVQQLSRTPAWSMIPAIRPWRAGFALVWNEYLPGRRLARRATSSSSVVSAFVEWQAVHSSTVRDRSPQRGRPAVDAKDASGHRVPGRSPSQGRTTCKASKLSRARPSAASPWRSASDCS